MGIGKNIKTITKNKGMTLVELSKKKWCITKYYSYAYA